MTLSPGYQAHYRRLDDLVLESQAQLEADLPEYALADLQLAKKQIEILERWISAKISKIPTSGKNS